MAGDSWDAGRATDSYDVPRRNLPDLGSPFTVRSSSPGLPDLGSPFTVRPGNDPNGRQPSGNTGGNPFTDGTAPVRQPPSNPGMAPLPQQTQDVAAGTKPALQPPPPGPQPTPVVQPGRQPDPYAAPRLQSPAQIATTGAPVTPVNPMTPTASAAPIVDPLILGNLSAMHPAYNWAHFEPMMRHYSSVLQGRKGPHGI